MCQKCLQFRKEELFVLLVDFDLRAFTSKISHSDPEVRKSTTYAVVSCFLENCLHIHREFYPFSGCLACRNRRQQCCKYVKQNRM